MSAPRETRPGRWKRRVLAAALILPALGAALWFGNIWRLTRLRDRLLAEAERYGPVSWRELAGRTLDEARRNPGAADEFLAALASLGGEIGRRQGYAEIIDDATRDWLKIKASGPLPDFAVKALAGGQEALRRLHAVAGKPPLGQPRHAEV